MPLYQMLCIAKHFNDYAQIRELVRQTCHHLFDNGSTVRSLDYWGLKPLPTRMQRHDMNGTHHSKGDYWTVHFDTGPRVVKSLNQLMMLDPRVLRWHIVKLATKPEDLARWGNVVKHGSGYSRDNL
ncbi:ribosomal protein S6 [Flagelloscypha sp. PMI_526]|nr:ribosomal protein S6 [Flagelloscypha sp. PMI_526]